MTGVKIGGFDISTICKVMDVRRDVVPPRDWATANVPGRPGAYLMAKNVEPRFFEIEVLFRGDVETQRRALAAVVESDDEISLEFSDRPGIKYFGVLIGPSIIARQWHTGRAVLTFMLPDPYGYGEQRAIPLPSDGVLDVEGDAPAYPIFVTTFDQPSTFFSIMNEDSYLLVGESADVEQTVVEAEELVFWDELGSMQGWGKWGGAVDGGDIAGEMASNGNAFYALDTGDGNFWHGPAVVKALGEPLQDFLVEMQATQLSNSTAQMGRVELYLLNANGGTVAKLIIRDSDPWTYTNYAFARLGQGENMKYIIDRKDKKLNGFSRDKLRLRRDGTLIRAHIGRYDNDEKLLWSTGGTYHDMGGQYQDPITHVAIAIGARADAPLSISRADDLKVWKLNDVEPVQQVNRLFSQGSMLELNGRSGVVYKDGGRAEQYLDPRSDFFTLKPGKNALATTAEGPTKTTVIYQSRWY